MEAPRGSSITWIPAPTAASDRTTASKTGNTELEKAPVGKTAEIKTWKGLKAGIKTEMETCSEETAPVEMKRRIEGGAHISREDVKTPNTQRPGLKPPGPNLSSKHRSRTDQTPGLKTGTEVETEEGVSPSLAAQLLPRTPGRLPGPTGSRLRLEPARKFQ